MCYVTTPKESLGYQPWSRQVTIYARLSAWLENLFICMGLYAFNFVLFLLRVIFQTDWRYGHAKITISFIE